LILKAGAGRRPLCSYEHLLSHVGTNINKVDKDLGQWRVQGKIKDIF